MSPKPTAEQGVAIVGMAGRFPKARDIEEFWRNLCEGVDAVTHFTDEDLAAEGVEAPSGDPHYVKARAVLEGADMLDAGFFGMNPREAELMDPQHRVFLECAWEALENAGCDPARFDGAIGVFGGMSMNTYLARNLLSRPELVAQVGDYQLKLGNDKDFLPMRVSYKFNLRGPSVNIQSACSTSLVAVCVACQSLLNYECDMALAGAVSITFPQKCGYHFQEGGIGSPDGHCRAFDAKAAGTVLGEGVGIVVLKRVEDAIAAGDTIYAVIKGFAVNNDGSNKMAYAAPSVQGQAEVIATAQAMAGISPESISYIEAHGTATPVGDPIEIEALTRAFRLGTAKKGACAVGSVKTNIGHLDTTAGVAGLIKTALALHHKKIPPSLHFQSPNPQIDFASGPFYVNAKLADWKSGPVPRRAGINSLGIGGTNAHVVLEEAPAAESSARTRPAHLLLLSAKTESALATASVNLAAHLKKNPAANMADVAYTLQTGRQEFAHRKIVACRSAGDATIALEAAKHPFTSVAKRENPPVVFMFTGQGAQQVNMGLELYQQEPVFREQVDACCSILAPHLGIDLRTVLYPDADKAAEAEKQLLQTALTQPALFVIEYALAKLWMSWGIKPEAMIGHSIGEYVAACLAGVFPLADALALVAARGRLMQIQPGGTMIAVRLPERELTPFLNESVSLATVNAPSLCVLSGPTDTIEKLRIELASKNIASTPLQTSHAFHSAMMDPVLAQFTQLAGQMKLGAPQIPFLSNVTGDWITPAQAANPRYWADHLRRTVRFADGLATLAKDQGRVLLEVGPGKTLANLAKQHPQWNASGIAIASLATPGFDGVMTALGQLWLAGVKIDWKAFYKNEPRRLVPLPAYPFERKRYWIEPARTNRAQTAEPAKEPSSESAVEIPIPAAAAGEAPTRQDEIAAILRKLLGELSGLDLSAANGEPTFTALGFDSLFLTQASVMIENKFSVPVAFRQLLEEFSTVEKLAGHIAGWQAPSTETSDDSSEAPTAQADPPEKIATLPLTDAQKEFWLTSQKSDEASCSCNESQLLTLRGRLRKDVLLGGMLKLVRRHEALRATFAPDGSGQRIQPAMTIKIPILDWSAKPANERAACLETLQHEDATQAFDLTNGPLLRTRLISLGGDESIFMLTVHHIICDGVSLGILLRELAAIYSAEREGAAWGLGQPMQLSNFVRLRTRDSAESETDEMFWREQFAESAPVLELPTDRPRSPARTFQGAIQSRPLPASLARQLKQLNKDHGGTLFTSLLAGFSVWLHRLSGQNEVVIGLPIADRAMTGGETLVAHCVDFLPLRIKLGSEPVADFRGRLQRQFFDAYEHRRLSLGRLMQTLNLPRDPSRPPLIAATLNLIHLQEKLQFSGLEADLKANIHAYSNYDLGINVTEMGDTLLLGCRYNSSLFSGETIQRWLGHFQTLLEGMASNPAQSVSDLPLLSPEEQDKILQEGKGEGAIYPAEKCVHQLFEEQARRAPEAIAVVLENEKITYDDLNRRANRLAHHLQSLGVGSEVMVALCLERSVEMIVSILAVLKAGGAYVPLDPAYPADRLAFILQDAKAPVVITQRSLSGKFPAEANAIYVENCLDSADHNPTSGVRPRNLAYVIYTSGSTGNPKGVQVTHHNMARLFHATQPWFEFNQQDVWTLFHSYAFDFSVWEIWGALIYGGRLVIVPHLVTRSPDKFLELLAREKVTVLNQTPSAFRQLMQAEEREEEPSKLSLRYVLFGGESLDFRGLKPWFARHGDQRPQLVNMYGITETTVHVTYRPIRAEDTSLGSVIGRPIPDLEFFILDAKLRPVPVGLSGEIFVGGAGVARGYLNRPELTTERFVPHPFDGASGARLYKTGDLARRLANGEIEYLGRGDDQVKIRGHRIELGEIESTLLQHPAIRECVALARRDVPDDPRLIAYFVADADKGGVSARELRKFVKSKLPDPMVPAAFVRLEAFPLTVNGKVNRKALPMPEQERPELDESFAAPGTPTEAAIAEMWREVLRLQTVGRHDNFFELGGHSLLMTQIISRLRAVFQVEVPMRRFFETPTVAGLSTAIEESLAEEIAQLSDEEVQHLARSTG